MKLSTALVLFGLIATVYCGTVNFNFEGLIPGQQEYPCPECAVCEECPPPVQVPDQVLSIEGSNNVGYVVAEYVDNIYETEDYLISYRIRDGAQASTSIGIELLLRGFVDVALASRVLNANDYNSRSCNGSHVVSGFATESCLGVLPRAVPISTDLVIIYVNNANPVTGVTAVQLKQLLGGATWKSVFGVGNDAPAKFYTLSSGSTRNYFVSVTGVDLTNATVAQSNDDALAKVMADPNAISYVAYEYLTTIAEPDSVKYLNYNNQIPLNNVAYQLTRILWAYYNVLATRPITADFLCDLVQSDAAINVGSIPNNEDTMNAIMLELGC